MSKLIQAYTQTIIRFRFLVIAVSIVSVLLIGSGGRFLGFDTDYRVFFGEDNPELQAFEALQNTYSKEDNIIIALTPNGALFAPENLSAIEWLTHEAWQIPYASRVDSITNYQHTYGEADDLIVENLFENAERMSAADIEKAKQIALSEPTLVKAVINPEGTITAINVINQFPAKSPDETKEAVEFARDLIDKFKQKYPQFQVHMTGVTTLNQAFQEASMDDMKTLIPAMYLIIFIVLYLLLRSFSAILGVMLVVVFAVISAMGSAGWIGISLTPPSVSAPTIIMTLAVADSVHFLVSMFALMRQGIDKNQAISESIRINLGPIFLTSVTTAIGFLALNFGDSPPFHDLGNITAIGVGFALILSLTFLPAWMSVLPLKIRVSGKERKQTMLRLADFVIARHKPILYTCVLIVVSLGALIPQIKIDDDFVKYFDKTIQFRTDSDYVIENLTGIKTVFYSVESGKSQGINDPEFLSRIDQFKQWLLSQKEVSHVNALTDTVKRLNKSLHADDQAYYRVPANQALAAQYLLLYEMSLPFGLDLNNQINVKKSASKVMVTLSHVSTAEIIDFNKRAEAWLKTNTPEPMHATGSSTAMMFSNITFRNIEQMLSGSVLALFIISLILIFALKSLRTGLFSLIPNLTPIVAAAGIWSIVYGQIGMAASFVFTMSIGIVVDDTVHFLSKYLRAKREKNLQTAEAIRYAFTTVGHALLVTSLVLTAGFAILAWSAFLGNQQTGILMALTIACALVLDFLLLPAVLLVFDKEKKA